MNPTIDMLVFQSHGNCANQSREPGGLKCKNRAVPGHIYCDPCRIALGGYNRYNRRAQKQTLQTGT